MGIGFNIISSGYWFTWKSQHYRNGKYISLSGNKGVKVIWVLGDSGKKGRLKGETKKHCLSKPFIERLYCKATKN